MDPIGGPSSPEDSVAGPSDHLAGITAALDRLTNHAASLPQKSDLSFHRTLDRGFAKSLDATSVRLLGLTEQLLTLVEGDLSKTRPGVKGKGRSKLLEEQDAVEGFRRSAGNVIDGLLENADSNLDDVSGQKKAPAIQVDPKLAAAALRKLPGPFAPAGPSSGKYAGGKLANNIMFADIPKPQLLFPDAVNTANNQPWTPTLSEKPHAMVPLNHPISTADILNASPTRDPKEFENRKKKLKERDHPYWYETQHLPYPTRMFEVAPPIPPVELDDCPLTFVDTPEALEEMVACLKEAKEIAVDLEHHSWRSYFGFTCLMQISTRERDWVVDTLKLRGELREGKLGNVMTDPNIVKVFHGADSDIIWLERDFDIYIVNLFDTYHATVVLNHPSHSLAALLARYCNFTADKRYQMADWRIRPLPKEMIDYARSDTHYLLFIYDHLRNALLEMSSRPTTPQPESATTLDNRVQEMETAVRQNPQAALRKTLELSAETALRLYEREEYAEDGKGGSGWKSLLKKSLPKDSEDTIEAAVLIALHRWRDDVARQYDESTFWVMPTFILTQIGILRAPTISAIERLVRAKSMMARSMAGDILKVVKAARKAWTDNPPAPILKPIPSGPAGEHIIFDSAPSSLPKAPRPTASAFVPARAPPRPDSGSLWEFSSGPSTAPQPVKSKSRSALFGNTVPSPKPLIPTAQPTGKPQSSMFGSTLRPAHAQNTQKKREKSPTFEEISRRIASGIAPSASTLAGILEDGAEVSVKTAGKTRLEPENVPFVPANKRVGYLALKEIAAKSRNASAEEGLKKSGQGGPAGEVVPPVGKKKDEVVPVKRQKGKAGKPVASAVPAVAREASALASSSGSTSASTPAPIEIDGAESAPAPVVQKKKEKKAKAPPAAIPDFDYTTEGNLLDHPDAAPREEADEGHKKKKKKKEKKSRVDAPPPGMSVRVVQGESADEVVMIQTPDFGKMPRDMSQPKAGARSKTFTS